MEKYMGEKWEQNQSLTKSHLVALYKFVPEK